MSVMLSLVLEPSLFGARMVRLVIALSCVPQVAARTNTGFDESPSIVCNTSPFIKHFITAKWTIAQPHSDLRSFQLQIEDCQTFAHYFKRVVFLKIRSSFCLVVDRLPFLSLAYDRVFRGVRLSEDRYFIPNRRDCWTKLIRNLLIPIIYSGAVWRAAFPVGRSSSGRWSSRSARNSSSARFSGSPACSARILWHF
jgi:hypothetical protein